MKYSLRIVTLAMSFAVILLVGFGCYKASNELAQNSGEIDKASILSEAKKSGLIMDDQEIQRMAATALTHPKNEKTLEDVSAYKALDWSSWQSGALADVTGGGSFGLAHIHKTSGGFTIAAQMGGLPFPDEHSYYEGWLVRRGDNLSVISTGKALLVEDRFYNVYTTEENLEEYDFYVLTLESDDLNPSPAKHLLEGVIE